MPNPFGAPEISVLSVAEKMKKEEPLVLVDVREPHELKSASLPDGTFVHLPLSRLAEQRLDALPESVRDKEAEIVIFCHHGMRSAQVVAWLAQQGWTNVLSMDGGIDAYASEIDSSVGKY